VVGTQGEKSFRCRGLQGTGCAGRESETQGGYSQSCTPRRSRRNTDQRRSQRPRTADLISRHPRDGTCAATFSCNGHAKPYGAQQPFGGGNWYTLSRSVSARRARKRLRSPPARPHRKPGCAPMHSISHPSPPESARVVVIGRRVSRYSLPQQ
jgi:hypothetical protein